MKALKLVKYPIHIHMPTMKSLRSKIPTLSYSCCSSCCYCFSSVTIFPSSNLFFFLYLDFSSHFFYLDFSLIYFLSISSFDFLSNFKIPFTHSYILLSLVWSFWQYLYLIDNVLLVWKISARFINRWYNSQASM